MAANGRIFENLVNGEERRTVLPWRLSLAFCWLNIRNRMGRLSLVLAGIAIVVAFLMSSLTYHNLVSELMKQDNVHTRAILEKAGLFANSAAAVKKQTDQRIWLMALSGILCLVGITNTMLMSVTERIREIGTLKCLGALDRFVVRLFLLESIFVGVIGSIIGALVGYVFTIIQVGLGLEFSTLSADFCLRALLYAPVAVGIGTVLTVLAAIYPTYVAAKMKPVDAMRVEV